MNVLTAAVDPEPDGFTWTVPGELVYLGQICDRDRLAGLDHGCGCGRAFAGVVTAKAATLAVVVPA